MLVWVVGSGGMLGAALTRAARREKAVVFETSRVPWDDTDAAIATLQRDAVRFHDEAGDAPWAVVWAAGSSIVSSSPGDTRAELLSLESVLDALTATPPPGPGVFFLTSSAGGVFAGSTGSPFGEATEPVPISPYGQLKLDQEHSATERLAGRLPLVIGRFSNLYGPDFNAAKGQGLIQQLCVAALRRRPLNLYVSMDTVRDYLYIDDAALLAWTAIDEALQRQPEEPATYIFASGQPTTIAQVIATVENVAHRRVPLALGTHPSARHQVIDLRLVPSTAALGGQTAPTPLPSGIKRVIDALAGRVA
jgi:UDP-glucose 4-epimerase